MLYWHLIDAVINGKTAQFPPFNGPNLAQAQAHSGIALNHSNRLIFPMNSTTPITIGQACGAMLCLLLGLAPLTAPAWGTTPTTPVAEHVVDVVHYSARLDPDLPGKKLSGRVVISLMVRAQGTQKIEFDAGDLVIDAVHERGAELAFEKIEQRLRVRFPHPMAAGDTHEIEIDYHGAPRFGLEFHPERGELYTIFSTSQWLVCVDAPDERATLDLSVALPVGLKAVGSGRFVSKSPIDGQRELYRWRQDEAVPSYVYGFAAGRYVEVTSHNAGIELRYMSTELNADELGRIFADTGDIFRFFGRRSGIHYRGSYTQVLVAETIGQELAGFALMSEDYGRNVLDNATAVSLIAHEIAHQWWGNRVTNRDWNHFWLNEGIANFMAAAYLQHRFGDEVYLEQVDGWHRRLDKLRATGTDRSLVFERWYRPSTDDRAVVYQKGAYVLHLLRENLGERAFWRGIRAYTHENYGRSVTTADFKRAMEHASGRDLSAFFAQWVDGVSEHPLRIDCSGGCMGGTL